LFKRIQQGRAEVSIIRFRRQTRQAVCSTAQCSGIGHSHLQAQLPFHGGDGARSQIARGPRHQRLDRGIHRLTGAGWQRDLAGGGKPNGGIISSGDHGIGGDGQRQAVEIGEGDCACGIGEANRRLP